MKIRSVQFVISAVDPEGELPVDLPRIAFLGRSNVGKSSLINTVLGRTRKGVARVSGQPGKTRALNFFNVNDEFYLVDLPGLGFAKVPAAVRAQWKSLVEGYLSSDRGPQGVALLVDVRRGLMEVDRSLLGLLSRLELPTLLVVTKVDKLGRQRREQALAAIVADSGLDADQVLPFSSVTGEGRDVVLGALAELLETPESQDQS